MKNAREYYSVDMSAKVFAKRIALIVIWIVKPIVAIVFAKRNVSEYAMNALSHA
jgi:hypothetical protein